MIQAAQNIQPYLPINTVGRVLLLPANVAATALCCLTLGQSKTINNLCKKTFSIETDILRELFLDIACFQDGSTRVRFKVQHQTRDESQRGIITETLTYPIFHFASNSAKSDSFAKRHVVSRLAFCAGALVCLATNILDLALGILLALRFLLKSENFPEDFDVTYRQLNSSFIVKDFCFSIRAAINPHQWN
jgi:hypothetical protein